MQDTMTSTANTTASIPFFTDDAALSHLVHSAPYPFYYTPKSQVLSWMSDETLAIVAPLVAYWVYSGLFVVLDAMPDAWLARFRIHESAEVTSRNRATKREVFIAVLFQQLVQTVLGWLWIEEEQEGIVQTCLADERWIRDTLLTCARMLLGNDAAEGVLRAYGAQAVRLLYWWGIPIAQLVFAMCVFHTNWPVFRVSLTNLKQVHYRHLAILPPSGDAHLALPLPLLPQLASPALCPLRLRGLIQSPG